jgi:MFS family permease
MREKLKILLLSSLFINLSAGFFGPIYAIFVEEIGGDVLTAGSSYAIFSIAAGILIFILGKWEDSIKHQEKLLVAGRFLAIIGFVGYLLVETPIHLFIVQIIFGISTAVVTPAFDSLYSKNLSKGKFASQWGAWESMYGIATGIAAIIGAFIAKEFGFKSLFILMLIFSIISFIISLYLLKKK